MKIQSAGRLGNILFIWAYAKWFQDTYKLNQITIFADKYHSKLNEELIDTFQSLSDEKIRFEINNYWGFILRVIDKLAVNHLRFSLIVQKLLRIHSEGRDGLTRKPRILRGYFQSPLIISQLNNDVFATLDKVLAQKAQEGRLTERFPFLSMPYQAMHIRLTDYIGSSFGVIDPSSQLSCLRENLQIVICTDGTEVDVLQRIDMKGIEILTPKNTTAWETLCVLSGAENLITTNSTLSWWSGFVAATKGKKVWIPKYWNPSKEITVTYPTLNASKYRPLFEN